MSANWDPAEAEFSPVIGRPAQTSSEPDSAAGRGDAIQARVDRVGQY